MSKNVHDDYQRRPLSDPNNIAEMVNYLRRVKGLSYTDFRKFLHLSLKDLKLLRSEDTKNELFSFNSLYRFYYFADLYLRTEYNSEYSIKLAGHLKEICHKELIMILEQI